MEKVRPLCGQPSDRGRLKNRTVFSTVLIKYNLGILLLLLLLLLNVRCLMECVVDGRTKYPAGKCHALSDSA